MPTKSVIRQTGSHAFQRVCLLLTVPLVLLLSACAVTPEYRATFEPQAVTLAPKQGVVMVKVSSNRNIGTFFGKWQKIIVKNVQTEDTYDLIDRSPTHALHSLYVGSLPVGTYQLEKFDSQAHGAISIYSSAELGAKQGRFSVAEGKVTDLGSIVYIRNNYPNNSGKYRLAFANIPFETENSLKSLEEKVAAAGKAGLLTWEPPTGEEKRTPLNKRDADFSVFLTDPHLTQDGAMLFGEAFGLIGRRESSGRWSWLDTGILNTIISLHIAQNGTIFAGSEQSLLMAKAPQSASWKQIPFPLKDATIRFIGEHPQLGYIVVAQDRRDIVTLTCKVLTNPSWSELYKVPVELFLSPLMDTQFDAFMAKDKLIIVTRSPQFTLKIAFHVLDIPTRAWSEIPIDLYGLSYAAMDDGSVYAMAGPNISQNFYVSKNYGATWEKRESPNWMGPPVFRDTENGFALRVESIPLFDSEKLTNSFWKTNNGGRSWEMVGDAPNLSAKLILLPKENEILLVTYNGKIFFSNNNGANWNPERAIQ